MEGWLLIVIGVIGMGASGYSIYTKIMWNRELNYIAKRLKEEENRGNI
jgi:F0F1-type ATP synthase assembly protein I